MGKIYKGEWGIEIRCKTGIDLTGAQSKELHIIKPDGRKIAKPANVESPATNGILTYVTELDDFDVCGLYKIHSHVSFIGSRFRGETAIFKVYDGKKD